MSQEFQTADEFQIYLRDRAVEDEDFRARLLADPKAVVEGELDLSIPDGFTLEVHEDSAWTAHLVLPPSSALAESDLSAVAAGGSGHWCSPV